MEPTPEEKEKFRKLCIDENGKLTTLGVLATLLVVDKAFSIWTDFLKKTKD